MVALVVMVSTMVQTESRSLTQIVATPDQMQSAMKLSSMFKVLARASRCRLYHAGYIKTHGSELRGQEEAGRT